MEDRRERLQCLTITKVAIVGGGISGLTCASLGKKVMLQHFEKDDSLGRLKLMRMFCLKYSSGN